MVLLRAATDRGIARLARLGASERRGAPCILVLDSWDILSVATHDLGPEPRMTGQNILRKRGAFIDDSLFQKRRTTEPVRETLTVLPKLVRPTTLSSIICIDICTSTLAARSNHSNPLWSRDVDSQAD